MTRCLISACCGVVLALAGCPKPAGGPASPTAKSSPSAAPAAKLVVERTLLLRGSGGKTLVILELEGGDALLHPTGTGGPFDKMVVRHEAERTPRYVSYRAQWRGRKWITARQHESHGGRISWTVTLPDYGSVRLKLVEAAKDPVDPAPILALHQRQLKSGALERLARFHRPDEEQRLAKRLERFKPRLERECKRVPVLQIDYASIGDQAIRRIGSRFSALLAQIASLCRREPVRRALTDAFNKVVFPRRRQDFARGARRGSPPGRSASIRSTPAPRRSRGCARSRTRRAGRSRRSRGPPRSIFASTARRARWCSLGEAAPVAGVAYGDGKSFSLAPYQRYLSRGWFFDPRQFAPTYNNSFRGRDLRVYSHIKADRERGRCKLTCGTRTTELKLADFSTKWSVLQKAKLSPPAHQREPYALARDRRGVYYYVDRGATPQTRRDYRVYIGRRGNVRRQKMKDVISDSEGEVFSTRTGKLRLVVGKSNALWIRGRRKTPLLWVPVRANYNMIYNELGAYLGVKLGVPCDDY